MKLIHNVAAKLAIALLPVVTMWALLFYFVMVNEISDEADDLLQIISEEVMARELSGLDIPFSKIVRGDRYRVCRITEEQFKCNHSMEYYDGTYYVEETGETEPARFLRTQFRNGNGECFEITVYTPTFEKDELLKTIFSWLLALYIFLVLTVLVITLAVMQKSMTPLYSILGWLKSYTPGTATEVIKTGTNVFEFKELEKAVTETVTRSDNAFERQKQFIGNAAHELQTPLALLAGRIDWLLNDESLGEAQASELYCMSRDVGKLSRLNKTLLLLSRIDNGQFPETDIIYPDILIRQYSRTCNEIFSDKEICMEYEAENSAVSFRMNESLAEILFSNLIRNAYVHSVRGDRILASLRNDQFVIRNNGPAALDEGRIFERFYRGTKKEGSTGLGLALCKTIAERYSMRMKYSFEDGMHCFFLIF